MENHSISARTLYALAEAITGGPGNSPEKPIGLYRSGREIEKFFRILGHAVTLGSNSRLPFTEETLMEIAGRPDGHDRIVAIVEATADRRDFRGKEDALQRVVDYLNECLRSDGFRLAEEDMQYRLRPLHGGGPDDTVTPNGYDYEVALSYASEDRAYVGQVAEALKEHGTRIFYDQYEEANMWGKDLSAHLDDVFRKQARYCVIFISRHYAEKEWTIHERRSAFARAIKDHGDYVLPARFDDTELPGLQPLIHYMDLRDKTPEELADLIREKLSRLS